MVKRTSKKDRKSWRNIDRYFFRRKKRQSYIEELIIMSERRCSICGKRLEEWEDDPCDECRNDEASFVLNENIWPNEEDF